MMEIVVEKTNLQSLGDAWIRGLQDRDFDRLARYCQPDLHSQILTPKRNDTLNQVGDLIARYRQWFGKYDPIYCEQTRVGQVGRKLAIFYRFHLQDQGNWYAIEQQLYLTVKDGLVDSLQLLCSGFQPVETGIEAQPLPAQVNLPNPVTTPQRRLPDARLEFDAGSEKAGSTCAVLTPAIKAKLREMQSGQLLEVSVNDPSAQGDIEAWSRLSGNQLLEMSAGEAQELRFLLQKK